MVIVQVYLTIRAMPAGSLVYGVVITSTSDQRIKDPHWPPLAPSVIMATPFLARKYLLL
jgi:hypothetical protein